MSGNAIFHSVHTIRWVTPTRQGSFFSLCLRTKKGDITSAGAWDVLDVTPLPGRTPPKAFKGSSVLPNMTIWTFEPNAYVGMQSPAIGIWLWAFWDSKPAVQGVRLRKQWTTDEFVGHSVEMQERSAEELRAHAID